MESSQVNKHAHRLSLPLHNLHFGVLLIKSVATPVSSLRRKLRMFITVLHGANQRSLFNIHCKTVALLEWIKRKCGCEREDEIDLADLNGQAMCLPRHRSEVASGFLNQREKYILISVTATGDVLNPVYNSLLLNYDLHDPLCLAKLRGEETEKKPQASAESNSSTSSLTSQSQQRSSKRIRFLSGSAHQKDSE